jgi:hypothetical protein
VEKGVEWEEGVWRPHLPVVESGRKIFFQGKPSKKRVFTV